MELISRTEAITNGLGRYFTGNPCKRGHISERQVSGRGCIQCREMDPSKKARARRLEEIRAYDRMRDKRDREKRLALHKKWQKKNPEAYKRGRAASNARQRGKKLGLHGGFSRSDIVKILNGQKRICWWCGTKLGADYHLDHRIPLARGGSSDPGNMVASCPPCNRSKGAKMPCEFAGVLL